MHRNSLGSHWNSRCSENISELRDEACRARHWASRPLRCKVIQLNPRSKFAREIVEAHRAGGNSILIVFLYRRREPTLLFGNNNHERTLLSPPSRLPTYSLTPEGVSSAQLLSLLHSDILFISREVRRSTSSYPLLRREFFPNPVEFL